MKPRTSKPRRSGGGASTPSRGGGSTACSADPPAASCSAWSGSGSGGSGLARALTRRRRPKLQVAGPAARCGQLALELLLVLQQSLQVLQRFGRDAGVGRQPDGGIERAGQGLACSAPPRPPAKAPSRARQACRPARRLARSSLGMKTGSPSSAISGAAKAGGATLSTGGNAMPHIEHRRHRHGTEGDRAAWEPACAAYFSGPHIDEPYQGPGGEAFADRPDSIGRLRRGVAALPAAATAKASLSEPSAAPSSLRAAISSASLSRKPCGSPETVIVVRHRAGGTGMGAIAASYATCAITNGRLPPAGAFPASEDRLAPRAADRGRLPTLHGAPGPCCQLLARPVMRSSRRGRRRFSGISPALGISAAAGRGEPVSTVSFFPPPSAVEPLPLCPLAADVSTRRASGSRRRRRARLGPLRRPTAGANLGDAIGQGAPLIAARRTPRLTRCRRRAAAPMRRISPMKCAACRASRSCVAASSARSLAMVAAC